MANQTTPKQHRPVAFPNNSSFPLILELVTNHLDRLTVAIRNDSSFRIIMNLVEKDNFPVTCQSLMAALERGDEKVILLLLRHANPRANGNCLFEVLLKQSRKDLIPYLHATNPNVTPPYETFELALRQENFEIFEFLNEKYPLVDWEIKVIGHSLCGKKAWTAIVWLYSHVNNRETETYLLQKALTLECPFRVVQTMVERKNIWNPRFTIYFIYNGDWEGLQWAKSNTTIPRLKACHLPVPIFPSNPNQIHPKELIDFYLTLNISLRFNGLPRDAKHNYDVWKCLQEKSYWTSGENKMWFQTFCKFVRHYSPECQNDSILLRQTLEMYLCLKPNCGDVKPYWVWLRRSVCQTGNQWVIPSLSKRHPWHKDPDVERAEAGKVHQIEQFKSIIQTVLPRDLWKCIEFHLVSFD